MGYLIGEIGQNHNGSVDLAKLLVEIAARPVIDETFGHIYRGFDAVKLTKRDLRYELTHSAMNRPYDSIHSFGKTYGEHREYLELSDEEHLEVYQCAKENKLDFIETLCAPSNLSILKLFYPDKLKVASRDLTNLPLLKALAETKIPIILSTGMASEKDIDTALETIIPSHGDISILHCLSEYPTNPVNLNLLSIRKLKSLYPDFVIGYSDHSIGISTPLAAVAMGAEIIEKHITLDRRMKGTDQAGSLGIDGMARLKRDIRSLELSLGQEEIFVSPSVKSARMKLERSIATSKKLMKGEIISEDHLILLSPGDGYKWVDRDQIIGKKCLKSIEENELIYPDHLYD